MVVRHALATLRAHADDMFALAGHKSLLKMIDFFRTLARNDSELSHICVYACACLPFADTAARYGRKMTQLSCMAVARDGSLVLDDRGAVSQNDIAPVASAWESFNKHVHERASRASKSAAEIEAVIDELELWIKARALCVLGRAGMHGG